MSAEQKNSIRAPEDDSELVRRASQGDSAALGELFVRHSLAVRRLLASILGPGQDLDDLAQDVFVQVHKSIKSFRLEASFKTWLHRLTVNVAISHMRRSKRRHLSVDPISFDRVGETGRPDAHDALVIKETVRRFYAILQTLTPKRRVALALFAVEGRSIAEAAEVAGVSQAIMKSRIWFARRELMNKAGQDSYLAPLLSEIVK